MKRTSTPRSAPERRQVDELVVVDAALHDGVELDRVEPGLEGGVDAVEHVVELVAPGHLHEPLAVERVEADVDPPQPGRPQLGGEQAQRGAVGRHRHVDAERGELLDEQRQAGPHGRLAAGEADRLDAVAAHHQPGDALDLLERQHLAAGQPLHPLLGHAVRAAEVAAVGDGDPQVADDAPERVDEILGPRHHATLVAEVENQYRHVRAGRRRRRRRGARRGRRRAPWRRAGGCPGRRRGGRGSGRRRRTRR